MHDQKEIFGRNSVHVRFRELEYRMNSIPFFSASQKKRISALQITILLCAKCHELVRNGYSPIVLMLKGNCSIHKFSFPLNKCCYLPRDPFTERFTNMLTAPRLLSRSHWKWWQESSSDRVVFLIKTVTFIHYLNTERWSIRQPRQNQEGSGSNLPGL